MLDELSLIRQEIYDHYNLEANANVLQNNNGNLNNNFNNNMNQNAFTEDFQNSTFRAVKDENGMIHAKGKTIYTCRNGGQASVDIHFDQKEQYFGEGTMLVEFHRCQPTSRLYFDGFFSLGASGEAKADKASPQNAKLDVGVNLLSDIGLIYNKPINNNGDPLSPLEKKYIVKLSLQQGYAKITKSNVYLDYNGTFDFGGLHYNCKGPSEVSSKEIRDNSNVLAQKIMTTCTIRK
jgi:hypothetical protein